MNTQLYIDFETYFDKNYTLKKQSMSEYIRHKNYRTICVGVKLNNNPIEVLSEKEFVILLNELNSKKTTVIAHNNYFDGFILSHHYNFIANYYICTKLLARAYYGNNLSASLENISNMLGFKKKLEDGLFPGKNINQYTKEELEQLYKYTYRDIECLVHIKERLINNISDKEKDIMNETLKMFIIPKININKSLLENHIQKLENDIHKKLIYCNTIINFEEILSKTKPGINNKKYKKLKESSITEWIKTIIQSRILFTKILEHYKIDPPKQISPTTNKLSISYAKTNIEFLNLKNSEIPEIKTLVSLKLELNSSIERTRIQRLINRAEYKLPVYLEYNGAHTMRWSGGDGVNLQNLPTRNESSRIIKQSLTPPENNVFIIADSSQIEARINCWFWGQKNMLDIFKKYDYNTGTDPYCYLASQIYKRNITKEDKDERFIGKLAVLGLGYGMGHNRFLEYAKITGINLTENEAKKIIHIYRQTNKKIVNGWYTLDNFLDYMIHTDCYKNYNGLVFNHNKIKMPNGLYLNYSELEKQSEFDPINKRYNTKYKFLQKNKRTYIYGAKLNENIIQCLARILISEQLLKITKKHTVALLVHDAIVCILKDNKELQSNIKQISNILNTPSEWCRDLPLNNEIKIQNNL